MRLTAQLAAMLISTMGIAAQAATPLNVVVYATGQSDGSMWAGTTQAYTKTFQVTVTNLGNEAVNLAQYCLKALTADNKVFTVDTLDDALSKFRLEKGSSTRGEVVFSSADIAIRQASMVKLSRNCP